MIIFAIFLAILLVLLLAYDAGVIYLGENRLLDDNARAKASGSFLDLKNGYVRYELAGKPEAPVVALVHGFSVPAYIWDPTFTALSRRFRVLRFDLYGRGYSDRPQVDYNLNLYVAQLSELLNALEIPKLRGAVGLSMGGPIVAAFAGRNPQQVEKLVLVDPVGFAEPGAGLLGIIRLPVIGEFLMGVFGGRLLVRALMSDFASPQRFPEFQSQYLPQMQFRGFKRALLSTLRTGPLRDERDTYRHTAAQAHPVLLIWGQEDKTVPFALHEQALTIFPQAEFHPIEGAGHIPHYEQPGVVNPILEAYLAA